MFIKKLKIPNTIKTKIDWAQFDFVIICKSSIWSSIMTTLLILKSNENLPTQMFISTQRIFRSESDF